MVDEGSKLPGRRDQILDAARTAAKSYGYNGLNFRHLAAEVGITSASLHYHFPTKSDLGKALAQQYCKDAEVELGAVATQESELTPRLAAYVAIFRRTLEAGNQICLASQLGAEHDDLPQAVKAALSAFADLNTTWLHKVLTEAGKPEREAQSRAIAIFAAVSGAQLAGRSKGDIAVFDETIAAYRELGLII